MGGESYWYFIELDNDVPTTLEHLRNREFEAGRYEPAMAVHPMADELPLRFPVDVDAPSPGAQHPSPKAALEASGPSGTRSILDIVRVSDEPVAAPDPQDPLAMFGLAPGGRQLMTSYPLTPSVLEEAFGSTRPTRDAIERVLLGDESNEASESIWEIPRGTAIHIVVYQGDQPVEVFFLGYSFD